MARYPAVLKTRPVKGRINISKGQWLSSICSSGTLWKVKFNLSKFNCLFFYKQLVIIWILYVMCDFILILMATKSWLNIKINLKTLFKRKSLELKRENEFPVYFITYNSHHVILMHSNMNNWTRIEFCCFITWFYGWIDKS